MTNDNKNIKGNDCGTLGHCILVAEGDEDFPCILVTESSLRYDGELEWTDCRKNIYHIHRFNYCPECGEKLDWSKIRKRAKKLF